VLPRSTSIQGCRFLQMFPLMQTTMKINFPNVLFQMQILFSFYTRHLYWLFMSHFIHDNGMEMEQNLTLLQF
jgi:hypothetical protein